MTQLRNILSVAEELGISAQYVIPWGRHRAKIELEAATAGNGKSGRLVLVSAINPTPPGEGKTTTSIALAMGLRKRGRKAVPALREPSLGPVFGVKGGGTGGGQAQLEPASDINLHFTGDIHAVTSAHNLLAALVDNALQFGVPVALDGRTITWPRAMDMNDRSLRKMIIGLGGKSEGVPRETRFDITAASEVMAILCLASDLRDLERRCARIVIGRGTDGKPVRAGDIFAQAAMTALLRDAMLPNLVQTREGGPGIVHGGPFGNIAHGCSTIVGTRMALAYADEVITEGGFGFDLGGEKFLDIKCRTAGLWPRMVVLVATLRALKYHGGVPLASVGLPDREALKRGFDHLAKHSESLAGYGLPVLVAVNRFPNDTQAELDELGAFVSDRAAGFATHEGFTRGGDGSLELADAVLDVLNRPEAPPEPKFLYELNAPVEDKIRTIARRIYGADDVAFTPAAKKQIEGIVAMGEGNLPICIAKTHLSLTDDATRVGRPRGFVVTVREVRLSAGAGYLVALTGEIMTMPGLPKEPASRRVVVHDDGRITGLMQGE